jgi:hypothetical protein
MLQSHSLSSLTRAAALHVPLRPLSLQMLQHISQQQGVRHTCHCSYERASIEAWFASGKTTSPKTGAQLTGQPLRQRCAASLLVSLRVQGSR